MTMYSDRCLFWEQGTLLQPQHFQILTAQAQNAARHLAATLCPHPWGVLRLTVREDALPLYQFALDELDMVLPGGEHVIVGTNAKVEARQFSEHWANQEVPLQVWLGLAPLAAHQPNVRDPQRPAPDAAPTRFVIDADPQAVPDLYAAEPQADVHFMSYELHILFDTEKERLADMPAVPLARIERDGERVRLTPEYVPPCLDIHASPVLLDALRAVRNTLTARAAQLAEAKILPGTMDDGQAWFSSQSLGVYTMLGVLSRYAPLADHLCETPVVHPWTAYGLLRQIAGELSMFSADLSPLGENEHGQRVLPAYDHSSPGPCFAAARHIISRIVESFVMGPAHLFTLECRQGQWFCDLPPSVCGASFRYWLLVRNATGRADLASHIARRAKLATSTLLPDLITRSLPGVRLLPVEQPPAGLPRRLDTLHFAVDQSDPLWNAVMAAGDAALFIPELSPDTVIHLALVHR